MGHEPDLGANLKLQMKEDGYNIDVEVLDILRDKVNLEFRRDSEADAQIEGDRLVVREFYPMNLLQKLSLEKTNVEQWQIEFAIFIHCLSEDIGKLWVIVAN